MIKATKVAGSMGNQSITPSDAGLIAKPPSPPLMGIRKPTGFVFFFLLLVVVLSAGLRLAYWAERVEQPDFLHPAIDAEYHDVWACALAGADVPWPPGTAGEGPYLRPPGYAFFLAWVYRLSGCSIQAAVVAQMGLGLLTVLLAFGIARRLGGPWTGLAAAFAVGFHWSGIYFEAELLDPALTGFLILLSILTLLHWRETPSARRAGLAGFLLAGVGLVRPNLLLFVPVAAAWVVWIGRGRGLGKRASISFAALVLAAAAILAPVAVRNLLVARAPVLVSANGGINLLIGNHPAADGTFRPPVWLGDFPSCFDYPRLLQKAEARAGRSLDPVQADRWFARQALAFIRDSPGRAAWLALRKARLFFGPVEIPHNKVEIGDKQNSRVLRFLPWPFPVLLGLAVVGAFLSTRPQDGGCDPNEQVHSGRQGAVLLAGLSGAFFLGYWPFFMSTQYRAPMAPLLAILFGIGLAKWLGLCRGRRVAAALIWAGSAAALIAGFYAVEVPMPAPKARWHFDRGLAWERAGDRTRALQAYARAVQADPAEVRARVNWGNLLFEDGRVEEAADLYACAIRLAPGLAGAHANLALALMRLGRTEEAEQHRQLAAQLDPVTYSFGSGKGTWTSNRNEGSITSGKDDP